MLALALSLSLSLSLALDLALALDLDLTSPTPPDPGFVVKGSCRISLVCVENCELRTYFLPLV